MLWAKRIAIGLAAAALLVIAGAYLTPREPVVTRSIDIAAPAAAVFRLVGDLRNFPDWSPWFAADPEIVITYTGPLEGVGQTMTWVSRRAEVGSGRQTITMSEPDGTVEMIIVFADQRMATTWFDLAPKGRTTTVTWGFRTDMGLNPINRYSGLWLGNIVGPDFERGLQRLKVLAELLPPATG